MSKEKSGPLTGLKVIDLAQFVAGSYCTMLLGDLGADVLKIEIPGSGDPYRKQGPQFIDDEGVLFLALNRSKRSVALDWKKPRGREVLRQLIAKADIFVQNARTGSLSRYELDQESLSRRFPELIYCSLSGYGQTGPYAQRGGFDLVLQGEGGLMSITGEKGGPPVKVGAPVLDIGAAMAGLVGILCALHARQQTGAGTCVDASLLDFSLATLTTTIQSYLATGAVPQRMGSASPQFAPYQAFRTAGQSITIAGTGSETLWQRLCELLGRIDLLEDSRFRTNADRVQNQTALAEIIESVLTTRSHEEWLARMEQAEIPAGPINTLGELLSDKHVVKRSAIIPVKGQGRRGIGSVAAPLRFGSKPLAARAYPPRLGEHTQEVLLEEGYSGDDIESLEAEGVIACA